MYRPQALQPAKYSVTLALVFSLAFAFLVVIAILAFAFAVLAATASAFLVAFAPCCLPLPSIDRSIGTVSDAAASACAQQLSKGIVLTCAEFFRMCEFKWQWFCTDGGASARMTPISAFPNVCAYSLQRSTLSVVCATASDRFRCGSARCRPVFLLSTRRVQSSQRLKTVTDFRVDHCHQGASLALYCWSQAQQRVCEPQL